MKGKAKIELIDINTNEKKEVIENNLVTNALENAIKSIITIQQRPEHANLHQSLCFTLANNNLLNLINGIMLFEDPLEEDVNNTYPEVHPIGYAGTSYDLSNPKRGSLNTQETKAFETDNKYGYRWVWDFGTSNCNTTFSGVCLTTSSAGDGNIGASTGSHSMKYNNTDMIDGYKVSSISYHTNPKCSKAFYKDGSLLISTQKGFKILEMNKNPITIDTKYNILSYKEIVVEGYDSFSNTIISYDDKILLAGKKQLENKWYLITTNIEGTVTEEKELTNVDIDIDYFSLVKDKMIINSKINSQTYTSSSNSGKYIVHFPMNIYDMTNHVFYKNKKVGKQESSNYNFVFGYFPQSNYISIGQFEPITIRTLNSFMTVYSSGSHSGTNNSSYYGGMTVIHDFDLENLETEKGIDYLRTGNIYYTEQSKTPSAISIPFNKVNSFAYSYYDRFQINFLPRTLFTINNLEEPITKTEANTMKITYELTWDK